MPQKLTPEIVIAAIAGFRAQQSQIESRISELQKMLDGHRSGTAETSETGQPQKKRKAFSAATRRKMAAAQRLRYSKLKQGSEPTQASLTKPKRKLSAQGRRAISLAAKKRWKAIKAAKQAA